VERTRTRYDAETVAVQQTRTRRTLIARTHTHSRAPDHAARTLLQRFRRTNLLTPRRRRVATTTTTIIILLLSRSVRFFRRRFRARTFSLWTNTHTHTHNINSTNMRRRCRCFGVNLYLLCHVLFVVFTRHAGR